MGVCLGVEISCCSAGIERVEAFSLFPGAVTAKIAASIAIVMYIFVSLFYPPPGAVPAEVDRLMITLI
jgi:hypothetical protein